MAAMLNWNADVVVVDGGIQREKSSVVVHHNVATVRSRQSLQVTDQRDQVVGVMPVVGDPKKRTITFADGSTWLVSKAKGCGCR